MIKVDKIRAQLKIRMVDLDEKLRNVFCRQIHISPTGIVGKLLGMRFFRNLFLKFFSFVEQEVY